MRPLSSLGCNTSARAGAAAGLVPAIRTTGERLRWREVKEIPILAEMISSPYDPERATDPNGASTGSATLLIETGYADNSYRRGGPHA